MARCSVKESTVTIVPLSYFISYRGRLGVLSVCPSRKSPCRGLIEDISRNPCIYIRIFSSVSSGRKILLSLYLCTSTAELKYEICTIPAPRYSYMFIVFLNKSRSVERFVSLWWLKLSTSSSPQATSVKKRFDAAYCADYRHMSSFHATLQSASYGTSTSLYSVMSLSLLWVRVSLRKCPKRITNESHVKNFIYV